MFRPISFWLTFHWGGMTPMRRLLSPGGSERCSSTAWGGGATRPFLAQWAELEPQTLTHPLSTHTLWSTLHTLRVNSPLSRKFWREQLLRVRQWQVYSRFLQAHKREADWQSCGITTRVEAVCRTKWASCLSASPPSTLGAFRRALPGCLHIIKVSSLLSEEQPCIGLGWKEKTETGQAWEKESRAAEEAAESHRQWENTSEELCMKLRFRLSNTEVLRKLLHHCITNISHN